MLRTGCHDDVLGRRLDVVVSLEVLCHRLAEFHRSRPTRVLRATLLQSPDRRFDNLGWRVETRLADSPSHNIRTRWLEVWRKPHSQTIVARGYAGHAAHRPQIPNEGMQGCRRVFKRVGRVGWTPHGWQSSYAMDCRSMDPGANPGPCSIFRLSNRSRGRPIRGLHFLLKE